MRNQMRSLSGLSTVCVLAGVLCALATPARAQWSSASVFTEDGVELGVEPRIFSLYAILNSAGYDRESIRGPLPLERPLYSKTREKVRQNLGRSASKEIVALFEKNPAPVETYVQAILELGPAPRFDDKAATSPLAKALAAPLREWFNEEGGSALLRGANEDARAMQKRFLPQLAAAIKATTSLVRLGDASDQLLEDNGSASGRVAVVLNDLDAAGTLFVMETKDTTGILTGPSRGTEDDEAILDAATLAYARTLVAGEAQKVVAGGTLVEGYSKLADATKKAIATDKQYTVELLACSVAREVRKHALACGALDKDPEAQAALALIAPRMTSYATTTALITAAMGELLAPPPPPAPVPEVAPPKEEPKKKGKKG